MEKIWLQSYSPGVPADINPDAYQSLVDIFEQSCHQYANLPAVYNLGVTLTYQQLDQYSRLFAAYLQQKLNLKKGDRIAIMLPNILQYPVAMFGALRAGLIVVNVNPLYTPPELIHLLQDSGAETIVVLDHFANTLEHALSQTKIKNIVVTQVGDFLPKIKSWIIHFVLKYIKKQIPKWHLPAAISFEEIFSEANDLTLEQVILNGRDVAFLQYTGGTTGVSKGAMLTHRNLIANMLQADAWFPNKLEKGKEIMITALPLYHIFSLMANCLYMIEMGALSVLITNPRDISSMIAEMKKFKFSIITGVNTLFNALLKNSAFSKLNFSYLKIALGGGAAVQKAVAEKWQVITGVPISEAYGLTEASPCVSLNPVGIKNYNASIGLPVSSTEVAILDDEHHEVPLGTPGELAVKGPQIMLGYWNNPAETAHVFTPDGWLLTGDLGTMDDKGFLHLLERKKDMILVSGFNVYPNEIEDVLVTIPGVAEAAVVGVPDQNSGEAVKAFIVKNNPKLTENDVLRFCHQSLTGYKLPKYIEFCKELPKSNIGKILRRKLRDSHVSA